MDTITPSDRMQALLKYTSMNVSEFADSIGARTAQSIHDVINGKTASISKNMCRLITSKYSEISDNWLLTGNGEMLHSSPPNETSVGHYLSDEEDYRKAVEKGLNLIPEFSGSLRGGNQGEMSLGDNIVAYWGFPSDIKANAIMEIDGDSMADRYPAGSKVALKEIYFDRDFPTAGISFGDAFGIILDNGDDDYIRYIKILRRHPNPQLSQKYWIAQSVNREKYDDFEIDIARVKHLFRVVLCITPDRI